MVCFQVPPKLHLLTLEIKCFVHLANHIPVSEHQAFLDNSLSNHLDETVKDFTHCHKWWAKEHHDLTLAIINMACLLVMIPGLTDDMIGSGFSTPSHHPGLQISCTG